ncbi:MAG: hypothetical protein HFH36_12500 [Lachnospiraceae bacterium]|nr:hypothetical protein [Lachnospiraceae bacterium]
MRKGLRKGGVILYDPKEWKNHIVRYSRRYSIQPGEAEGTVYLIPSPGEIEQQGTPQNAENFNHMEQGIFENSGLISELEKRLNAIADSDDITLDQLSEIVSYIKNNKELIDGITTSKVNVSDIKEVAFSGSYNDLSDKPSIPSTVRVKGSAEGAFRVGDVSITPANIGLGDVDNTADANKNVNSAKALAVQPDNWKQGTDLPSTYPRGATIFLSNNPANKFNGISYCTIHTIKGYTNMACIQFLYPYNTNEDRFYFREALYNTDAWRPWYEVITSANIGSQSVNYATSAGSATKAAQDTNGNNIPNTYARRSIYGDNAISLGRKTGTTVGAKSFAMGYDVTASGNYSHAEGLTSTASGNYSHAEGNGISNGSASHAEGYGATAGGDYSHAEGSGTRASGNASHAEGRDTTASGDHSHAGGYGTIAENFASYAFGIHNRSMTTGGSMSAIAGDVLVIGNGSYSARSNAFRVTYSGNVFGIGAFQSSGADYAEFVKPWWDGNFYNEDRVGYFVTVKDGMLHKAEPSDYIYGITSGNPSVVGNADEDYYWRYERDAFNRIVMEDVPEMKIKTQTLKVLVPKYETKIIDYIQPDDEDWEPGYDGNNNPVPNAVYGEVEVCDEDGKPVMEEVEKIESVRDEKTGEYVMVETGNIIKSARMKLADGYDTSLQESYVPRAKRPEWDYVGMVGVLPIRDDGTCIPGQFCKCGKGGMATLAEQRDFDTFHVIERISDNVVSVIMK